ncbi:uncharacterized protein E0L32_004857 [Thyridium curvatum]|uniref:ribose-phosphate diphosphokinase n=1 Tax=Thyridium curvatum TaxID=1093900 RepID=A0A507B5J4_9PEZI|nr:uncharacterized protein E0L32_004857 [Thyridium curvatum]TPX15027.1 hypothetical protein E0L32_004857 [Thyridium curvatum]
MRNTLVFPGSSCPVLTGKICENLGMAPAEAELSQFANVGAPLTHRLRLDSAMPPLPRRLQALSRAGPGTFGETSVKILNSVREKDVFVVQSGSPHINDTIMELLIMISACKGGSANKITAVMPYFPYSRQSKKKSHRGAITARMLANLLGVAGVNHVVTVDLHASQMQGFFRCPVDNLHAEPLIARWIRHNVPNWKEAVVVSKNAGGTKRVTSLADALKLNFGMVTTDRRRGNNMSASMILNHLDGFDEQPILDAHTPPKQRPAEDSTAARPDRRAPRTVTDSQGSPQRVNGLSMRTADGRRSSSHAHHAHHAGSPAAETEEDHEYNDRRAHEVTHGRLVQGHIVEDDFFPSPEGSTADTSIPEEDPMTMSHASSFFRPEPHALGGSGDAEESSDEEDKLKDPKIEHMITLVGDVKNRTVLIIDDMIDKPGSWIAAAETVVKRGLAKKVYCIATHGVFGGDCLQQMQACDCIDSIVVTNSYPISEEKARHTGKLVVIDLSYLLAEAIRRNHFGESISPLFQHIAD